MVAVAMGITWAGYTLTLWGYCLVKGYDITLSDLVNPVNVYRWPATPPPIPPTQILPTSKRKAAKSAGGHSAPAAT
jgi:hypothetical protein